MSKFTTVLIFIVIILLIIAGGFIFYSYETQLSGQVGQVLQQAGGSSQASQIVKNLSSGVIVSTLAYGQVSNISGKNVTLTSGDSSLAIPFTDSTQVYTIVPPTSGGQGGSNQASDFSQIQVGQNLSVNIKILPDGSLQAVSAFISVAK